MEPAKSPLKGQKVPRPHYKALYLTAVSLNDRLRGEVADAKSDAADLERANDSLATQLLDAHQRGRKWMSAAVIEAVALVGVAILLLAR